MTLQAVVEAAQNVLIVGLQSYLKPFALVVVQSWCIRRLFIIGLEFLFCQLVHEIDAAIDPFATIGAQIGAIERGNERTMVQVVGRHLTEPAFALAVFLVVVACTVEFTLQTLAAQHDWLRTAFAISIEARYILDEGYKLHALAGGVLCILLCRLTSNHLVADVVDVEGRHHLYLAGCYQLSGIVGHHGFRASVVVLDNLEQLVQSVNVCPFALVSHHQEGLDSKGFIGVQRLQGIHDDVLLEGYIIDVGADAALDGPFRFRTDKSIFVRIPRLGLDLNEFDIVTMLLQDIDAHKQIAKAESCLGNVHLVALHQFLCALQ